MSKYMYQNRELRSEKIRNFKLSMNKSTEPERYCRITLRLGGGGDCDLTWGAEET